MRKFFFHNGHTQQGPFDISELIAQGITAQTNIWYEGLSQWTPAAQVAELKLLFAATPPPFPAPIAPPPPASALENRIATPPTTSKRSRKPIIIGTATLVACTLSWLIYSNQSHAHELKSIQQQQAVQETEQQKVDIAVQQIEVEKQQIEAERKRINEELTKKNKEYRNNWYNYINVGHNQYQYRRMGGIYNLEVIVANNTDYILDEVTATVSYIKENGEIWRTVEVPVTNVPAHGEKRASVPDVNRGTSVNIEISGIHSSKMHFCYAPGNWANHGDDPYFCK